MGRFYFGQISGKFWFGVQSSSDPEYFGVTHTDVVQFHVCGCEIDDKFIERIVQDEITYINVNKPNIFCRDCFESYAQHKQSMIDDDITYDDNTWFASTAEIYYVFESKHIDFVKEQVQKLEDEVGKYMASYVIKDESDEITYDYTCPKDLLGNELILVARLCLGRQILHCLHIHGKCIFTAEL